MTTEERLRESAIRLRSALVATLIELKRWSNAYDPEVERVTALAQKALDEDRR